MTRRVLAAIVMMAVVAACGAVPTPPSAVPAVVAPGPASPASSAPPSASAPPTVTAEPSGAQATPALGLHGTWVSPKADARLSSYTTTVSARPTASGQGVTTFTKVVFSATWPGAGKQAICTARKPGPQGAWGCRANLLAHGVPPGKVTFSFDVHGEGVATAVEPDGPREVTYAVPPPRPTDTTLTLIKPPNWEVSNIGTYRVDWSAPAGYADDFLVQYTLECPRPSTEANNGKPCFVPGTPVDVTQLKGVAKVPGDERSTIVELAESECPGGIFGTILLRARNEHGQSRFAIVRTESVFWYDPDSNDIIC